uniref:Uncharacterized protein n=1 Tax=Rhizoctonia solani TaxID=456999 RepID=N0ABT1_9AGAM|nr:hypothetical protein RSOL_m00540 [Rhizoctonia solani]AGK45388.1 hypothetical protein RSOL_m00540 [Rhizoctonia solani]
MPATAKFSVPALDRRSRGGLQGRMANRGCFAVYFPRENKKLFSLPTDGSSIFLYGLFNKLNNPTEKFLSSKKSTIF